MYLISQFYSNRENLMLMKYTVYSNLIMGTAVLSFVGTSDVEQIGLELSLEGG